MSNYASVNFCYDTAKYNFDASAPNANHAIDHLMWLMERVRVEMSWPSEGWKFVKSGPVPAFTVVSNKVKCHLELTVECGDKIDVPLLIETQDPRLNNPCWHVWINGETDDPHLCHFEISSSEKMADALRKASDLIQQRAKTCAESRRA
jgi:hypothetical protein